MLWLAQVALRAKKKLERKAGNTGVSRIKKTA
jgi:hypothetical protein